MSLQGGSQSRGTLNPAIIVWGVEFSSVLRGKCGIFVEPLR